MELQALISVQRDKGRGVQPPSGGGSALARTGTLLPHSQGGKRGVSPLCLTLSVLCFIFGQSRVSLPARPSHGPAHQLLPYHPQPGGSPRLPGVS